MSWYQDSERHHHRGPRPMVRSEEHPSDEKRRLARINGEHLPAGHITDREDFAAEYAANIEEPES